MYEYAYICMRVHIPILTYLPDVRLIAEVRPEVKDHSMIAPVALLVEFFPVHMCKCKYKCFACVCVSMDLDILDLRI